MEKKVSMVGEYLGAMEGGAMIITMWSLWLMCHNVTILNQLMQHHTILLSDPRERSGSHGETHNVMHVMQEGLLTVKLKTIHLLLRSLKQPRTLL